MRIDPAGWPFIGGFLVVALVVGVVLPPLAAIVPLVLASVMLFFFRDPERLSPEQPGAVLSPADGRVMVAGPSLATAWPADEWQQVSIFLSPLDVHVNRIPVTGRVERVKYHPGRFLPAYRVDAGDLNEFTEVWLDAGEERVIVRQVVGLLARRIVCRTVAGASVSAGERFGVMKFGSRMDVFLPLTALIAVRPGDRVIGGVTLVASLAGASS
jgi:phosphatidylserine decarboxylase